MTFFLDIEPYLAEWFIFANGGEVPVKLAKGSIESKYLELFLSKPPKDTAYPLKRRGVEIEIPAYRYKPAMYWWWLSPRGERALEGIIRSRFDVQLWQDIHRVENCRELLQDILTAWMEANGIEPTDRNYNAVSKRYMRLRKRMAMRETRAQRKSGKKV